MAELQIRDLLSRFDPEPEGLLRDISRHINDDVLDWIAGADYGSDREKHMAALKQIRDTGTFPSNMVWYPAEVLELRRWSYPDDWEGSPLGLGEFGHWMGAFCCVALLRATREPYNYGDGIGTSDSVINLIRSLHALPVKFTTQSVRFLAWLLQDASPEGMDQQVCAYGLGLLWFSLQPDSQIQDVVLIQLVKWIVRRSKELFPKLIFEEGALPLRMGVGNPPPSPWGLLGLHLDALNLGGRSPALRTWTEAISESLSE